MSNYIKLLFYCNVVYTKIRRSIESIYRIDIRSFKIEFYTLHIRYINIPMSELQPVNRAVAVNRKAPARKRKFLFIAYLFFNKTYF